MNVFCAVTAWLVLQLFVCQAQARVFCKTDVFPTLRGAWLCNPDWIIDSSNQYQVGNLMDGDTNTTWNSMGEPGHGFVVFRLPKFYVLRRIKLRLDWGPAAVTKFRLFYWDDRNFEQYIVGGVNDHWQTLKLYRVGNPVCHKTSIAKEFRVPEQGRRVFGGFSRQSQYWKLEFNSTHGGEPPTLSDVTFFVVADLPATSNDPRHPVDPAAVSNIPLMAAPEDDQCEEVYKPVPYEIVTKYNLDTRFYHKFTSAYGIPIMGSSVLDDRALQRACYVVRFMLADRRDIRDHMYTNKGRVAIIGRQQTVPLVPEMSQYTWWTRRAAGGTFHNPVNVGAEENMLCEPQDGYAPAQDIFMHEFAHGIHLIAAHTAIPDFNYRLQNSFVSARRAGLWSNTYANTDNREYFAEGVQAYFNQQREGRPGGDGIQNHVNTREELKQHDPRLYSLIEEIFPCSNPYIPRCDDVYQTKGLAQKFKLDCNGGGGIRSTPAPGCKDDNPSCPAWKESGECQANPTYMLESCKLSCGVCGVATTTESLLTSPQTTTPSVTDPTCKDDNVHCDYWMRNGECEINPNYMLQSCKKSCRSCGKTTISPSTTLPVTSPLTTGSQPVTTGPTTGPLSTAPTTGPLTTGSTTGPLTTGSQPVTTGPTTGRLTAGSTTGPLTTGSTTGPLTTGSQPVTTGPTTGRLTAGSTTGPLTTESTTGPLTAVSTTGPLFTVPTTGPLTTGSTTGPLSTVPTTGPLSTGTTTGPLTTGPQTLTTGPVTGPPVQTTTGEIEVTTGIEVTGSSTTISTVTTKLTTTARPTVVSSTATTASTTTTTPEQTCEDDNKNCGYWKRIGECSRNPSYMMVSCRKSCGNCRPPIVDPTCEDDNVHCDYWMRNGECEINPNYMLQSCKKSCRSCGKTTISPSTTLPVTSPLTTGSQPVTTGPTTGPLSTAPTTGPLTAGSTTGPLTAGSTTGQPSTLPTTGPLTAGSTTGQPSTLPTTGPLTAGSTTGQPSTLPTTGPLTAGSTTGQPSTVPTTGPLTARSTTGPLTTESTTGPLTAGSTTGPLTTGAQTLTTEPVTGPPVQTTTGEIEVTTGIEVTDSSTTMSTVTTKLTTTARTTVVSSTATTASTTTTTPEQTCEDDNKNCGYWKRIGECSRNPSYMMVSCRKSCGNCRPPIVGSCSDSDVSCRNWKTYCYSNRYVIRNCRKTCGRC